MTPTPLTREKIEEIRAFTGGEMDRMTEELLQARGWTNNIREYEWDKRDMWAGAGFSYAVILQLRHDVRALLSELDRLTAELATAKAEGRREAANECIKWADGLDREGLDITAGAARQCARLINALTDTPTPKDTTP